MTYPADRLSSPTARRPRTSLYFGVAVLLHVLVLALVQHIALRPAALRQERELSASASRTQAAFARRRVRDLEKIKALLEESQGTDAKPGSPAAHAEPDVSAGAKSGRPEDTLAHARRLAREIEQIDQSLQAEALARILNVSKETAAKQLAAQEAKRQAQGVIDKSGQSREGQAAAEIQQLEARAMDALRRREQQLARQKNGVSVGRGVPPGGGAQLQERIGEFINRDVPLPEHADSAYADSGGKDLFGYVRRRVPAVDAGVLRKGTGSMIGAGGTLANRMYLNTWYVIGPFEGRHGLDAFKNYHYPPEDGVVLDAVYRGKGGRLVRWQYVNGQGYPLIPPDPAEDAVYYGFTELMSDTERDVVAWIGGDDDARVWLNDRVIWEGGDIEGDNKAWFWNAIFHTRNDYVRDFNLTEGRRLIHLHKGRNKLFFKLSNGATRVFFSMVLSPTD